MDFGPSATEYN